MGKQRIDAFPTAGNNVEHAFRQACFFQQLNDQQRGQRNFFARLQDERIPAGEREWKHPHRHHRWKIERRNPDADSKGLQYRFAVHAAGEIFERVAHEQGRDAAGIFDVFDAAISTAARFSQRFAVLTGNALANAIEVFFD